jgi:methylated-DNA-[protein]-cysteine S-methyltransferase
MCTRRADKANSDTVSLAGSGGAPSALAGGAATGFFHTPFGDGIVTVSGGRLTGVDLPGTAGASAAGNERGVVGGGEAAVGGDAAVSRGDREVLERWTRELEEYFAGERLSWVAEDIPLDALPVGDFARRVYATLLTVPPAVTVSYGLLAEMAGFPRAARAVGTAMATNPIPIVIPCHRVIRSDGSLGNYGNDPLWKEHLLSHERAHTEESGGER